MKIMDSENVEKTGEIRNMADVAVRESIWAVVETFYGYIMCVIWNISKFYYNRNQKLL